MGVLFRLDSRRGWCSRACTIRSKDAHRAWGHCCSLAVVDVTAACSDSCYFILICTGLSLFLHKKCYTSVRSLIPLVSQCQSNLSIYIMLRFGTIYTFYENPSFSNCNVRRFLEYDPSRWGHLEPSETPSRSYISLFVLPITHSPCDLSIVEKLTSSVLHVGYSDIVTLSSIYEPFAVWLCFYNLSDVCLLRYFRLLAQLVSITQRFPSSMASRQKTGIPASHRLQIRFTRQRDIIKQMRLIQLVSKAIQVFSHPAHLFELGA